MSVSDKMANLILLKSTISVMLFLGSPCLSNSADSITLELHLVANTRTVGTKEYALKRGDGSSEMLLLDSVVLLDQTFLKDVAVSKTPNGNSKILIKLNDSGSRLLGNITAKQLGNRIGVVLDERLICAPVVREPISGGCFVITGVFTEKEATEIVRKLKRIIGIYF